MAKGVDWHDAFFNVANKKMIKRRPVPKSQGAFEYAVKGRVFTKLGEAAIWSADEGNAEMGAVVLSSLHSEERERTFYVYDFKGALTDTIRQKPDGMVQALEKAVLINDRADRLGLRSPEKVERRRKAYRESLKRALIEQEKAKILEERQRALDAVKYSDVDGSW
ncbi:MAG: hypothetical protein LPK02_07170 [Rhodobacterales bacterium]|nr:hypothetical protein [Rhodobacterales bacterium]